MGVRRRDKTRGAIVALALATHVGVAHAAPPPAAGSAEAAAGEAPPPPKAVSPYQRHLDNGIKLYREGNYRAAVVEFEAAYRAEKKASPLVNKALSHKKLFEYVEAIDALEKALGEHSDTMGAKQREAAEREAREMRALLGTVRVQVIPAKARVSIDGREVPAAELDKPIRLSPGPHQIVAEHEGYKVARKALRLSSGQHELVALELEALGGRVVITGSDATVGIEVDGKPVGKGVWLGMLPPGVHVVRVMRDGEASDPLQILVEKGGVHKVVETSKGKLESASKAPAGTPPPEGYKAGAPPSALHGVYALAGGGMIFQVGQAPRFFSRDDRSNGGGALGVHVGYRVTGWAAFELMAQISDIGVKGTIDNGDETFRAKYNMRGIRGGPMFRTFLPTDTMIRFVGTVGAGLTVHELEWIGIDGAADPQSASIRNGLFEDVSAVGGYAQVDLGVSLEVSHILIDLVMQNTIVSTKGLSVESGEEAFDEQPVFLAGPVLRIGYGFW